MPQKTLLIILCALLTGAAWAAADKTVQGNASGIAQSEEKLNELPTGVLKDLNLPQMGDPADTTLSPREERQLGFRVVAQFYAFEYLLEDPEITDYLSTVGWKLAAASGTNPPHLQFFMVKDPRINAFALPGGYMGFNAGLLTASSTESELAGVMSHELAHVTQRHIARSASQSGGLATIATWAAVLAAIIAGSADPDVILAALSVGQSINYQRQVSFTRANELEADRIGIQTLAEAGFDSEGMAAFFHTLEQRSRLYGSGIPEILRTHPVNTTRITEARARAALLPKNKVENSLEYELMKARTQVFASTQPSDAVLAFSARIASGQDTPGNRYGLAMAQNLLGRANQALDSIAPVMDAYPRHPNLNLLVAGLHLDSGNTAKALEIYERTLAQHPRLAPVILAYSEALILSGAPDKAREILLNHEQALGVRLETYRLLAQAALEVDNNAEASYQMATYLFMRGDAGAALSHLDAGLRIANLSVQERARLSARRATVRSALPSNYELTNRRDRQRR